MQKTPPLSAAAWAVLGVVAEGPTHGFAVAAVLAPDGPLGQVWTLPRPMVYRELDKHRERHALDIFPADPRPSVDTDVLQALRAGDPHMLAAALHNDLQAPALHLEPSLVGVLELGEQNGALAGIVSGSGPTIAFLTADVDSALDLQIALSAAQLEVVRATGPVHGARIIAD